MVAGASGSIGSATLLELRQRGYWVRALARDMRNYPTLAAGADDVVLTDATRTLGTETMFQDVDAVVSCLGASVSPSAKETKSFWAVDTLANRLLIEQAKKAGVPRFVYVSVYLAPGYTQTEYVQAHEAVVERLEKSGLSHTVIRPTGVFAGFVEMLAYARYGFLPVVGDGTSRSNPVHERDIAETIADHLEAGPASVPIGGPEVFSRREIAEIMFRVQGRKAKVVSLPKGAFRFLGWMNGLGSTRRRELYQFLSAVSTTDCIAPRLGSRRFEPYLREMMGPLGRA